MTRTVSRAVTLKPTAVWVALALVVAVAASCSTWPQALDRGVRRGPDLQVLPSVQTVPVRGSDIVVAAFHDGRAWSAAGELLAVDGAAIWMLIDRHIVGVSRDAVSTAKVEIHKSRVGRVAAWAGVGTVTSLSHGLFFIFSGPLWLISGTAAVVREATSNDAPVTRLNIDKLRFFARYPAALPVAVRPWQEGRPLPYALADFWADDRPSQDISPATCGAPRECHPGERY